MSKHIGRPVSATVLALTLAASSLTIYACDDSNAVKDPGGASSGGTSGTSGGTSSGTLPDGGKNCFDNPKTHYEIINACTDATGLEKNPTLPKLLADGGLPPLK
jgi:hypothetical protein